MQAFEWSQYLVLAEELSTRSEEAALRSAVSRAYYAAYNTAKAFCNKQGISIQGGGNVHKDLWDTFSRRKGITFTSVGAKGDRLRRKRALADYESQMDKLSDVVADSIRDSTAILTFLRQ